MRERFKLGRELAKQGFTKAILLTNSLKSAILPWAANIPVRTGFKGEMRYGLVNDMRPLDKTVLKKTVERFVALGLDRNAAFPDELPQPVLLANREHTTALLAQFNIPQTPQPV